MAVTIKDVAALAGVSPSTVSRTCKNNPSISEETKERVRKAMAELGYEPNFQASNLASQNSRTIGIILPASAKEVYENSFYLEAIQGISHYCNGRQYMTTIVTGQDEAEILNAVHSMSRSGKVDGFIILYSKKEDPVIDYLFNEGLLYILIGKATQYTNQTIYIDNDNLLAGREAAEYLYQLGHRRIAYLGSDSSLMFSADRKAGYQLALASHQLPVRPEYCVEVKNVSENNEEVIRGLLMQKDRPTAILVSDDILAVSLERVCLENHLAIPEDLSIISFNNSLFARLTSPQLTSIDIGAGQLGSEAASQIINHIENPNLLATKIIVPHHLIERDSCCKI
ncbi:LacI family DNA-binding transcriptional regulator [Dorea longicatena]|uniref:LacI family DNA-binding transcriptional regulator n=1 Tax=Dorea longicatena TaxID=88431 RepID=UPI001FF25441|nr:LacI family DNA-binding transcriptional regulator [Dorea longicatena]UOX55322.1 LacI family DNA-binding transcriptional regulator [Dorea longicatena]